MKNGKEVNSKLLLFVGILIIIPLLIFGIQRFQLKTGSENLPSSTPPISSETRIPDSKDECLTQDGAWQKWGLGQEEYCQIRAEDAGKACTDGTQCSYGMCISRTDNTSSGTCAEFHTEFGCYTVIEKGGGQAICVD